MTSVATFELKALTALPVIQESASQYWYGHGYKVDAQSWRPGILDRVICVLEYFYYGNAHELDMMAMTAKYLLSVSQDNLLYYYRCIDFVGDIDTNHPNYFGGKFIGNLRVDNLVRPEYQPSMVSTDIYAIVP
jgi:hypothetical protein